MSELKAGDMVRRLSDGTLMEIDFTDESIACCHLIESPVVSHKIFIATDAIEIVPLGDTDLLQQ